MKALVWFWIIDETYVLTFVMSYDMSKVGAIQVMELSGTQVMMIKCSTWKRRKRKTKPYGDQDIGINRGFVSVTKTL